jgi:hypothetical protein
MLQLLKHSTIPRRNAPETELIQLCISLLQRELGEVDATSIPDWRISPFELDIHDMEIIGCGASGTVKRGVLDGMSVAVKQFNVVPNDEVGLSYLKY